MKSAEHCKLSGAEIRRLMRIHHVTIEDIATRFNLTRKRVREVRTAGVTGFSASEWHAIITGTWLH